MNKKQLRQYAKKFEGASDAARIAFSILALLGLWKLVDLFTNTTAMGIAAGVYVVLVGMGYWWVRREWRALLAPPPKPIRRKKPAPPKEMP